MKSVTAVRRQENFFQAHKDITVTSKDQARQKQLDFLGNMKVFQGERFSGLLEHVLSGC